MIMGIDPGVTGAIAMLYPDGKIFIEDMPVLKIKTSQRLKANKTLASRPKFRKWVDARTFADLLEEFPPHFVAIEMQTPRPMDGGVSGFGTGQNYGILLGVLAARKIPYFPITPASWKSELGLTSDKDASREMASNLYPEQHAYFKRVKDHDRAEALLIAHYGKTHLGMA